MQSDQSEDSGLGSQQWRNPLAYKCHISIYTLGQECFDIQTFYLTSLHWCNNELCNMHDVHRWSAGCCQHCYNITYIEVSQYYWELSWPRTVTMLQKNITILHRTVILHRNVTILHRTVTILHRTVIVLHRTVTILHRNVTENCHSITDNCYNII